MDLKDLKYFRTIAECGSISKAAAHLRVAQPAVSRKILKLEHDLGVQLLRRTSRGVTPTEAGQVLLQRSIDLERSIDETRREVARYAERPTGAFVSRSSRRCRKSWCRNWSGNTVTNTPTYRLS